MRKGWILIGIMIVSILVSGAGLADDQVEIKLESPPDDCMEGKKPLFEWKSLDDEAKYTLKVSENENLTDPIIDVSDIEGTSWGNDEEWKTVLEEGLTVSKKYYWKVTSDVPNGKSNIRSFTVGYTLTVTVKDEDGSPIEGASVLLKINGEIVSKSPTESDGTAEVHGIGDCQIEISMLNYKTHNEGIPLKEKNVDKSFTLYNKGTLRITLTDEEEKEVTNAKIVLISEEGQEIPYDINSNRILQGTYSVTVTADGFEDKTESVEVKADEEEVLQIKLEKRRYQVFVSVKDSEEEGIKFAEVFLDDKAVGITDEKGKLEIPEVAHGSHYFVVLKDGYELFEEDMDIESEEGTISISITLKLEQVQDEETDTGRNRERGVALGFISIILFIVLFMILLALYAKINSNLKKINSKFDKMIKDQEITLKESKKDINTMEEYLADILEKT